MAVKSRAGAVFAILGLAAFGALVTWFGILPRQRPTDTPPAVSKGLPAGNLPERQAALPREEKAAPNGPSDGIAGRQSSNSGQAGDEKPPGGEAKSSGAVTEPGRRPADAGQPRPDSLPSPSFDVVRVEPSGESVIAGRGAPGAMVEMLRSGEVFARSLADPSGLFALVPAPLPPGSHEIVLRSIAPNGTRSRSRESVTVVIGERRDARPLVTLNAPDKPTVVLSTPEAEPPPDFPDAVAGVPTGQADLAARSGPTGPDSSPAPRRPVQVVTVESEEGGRLFVSGKAAPGSTIRLYLNETLIAPGSAGGDGRVSFAIGRGIRPGDYRVRLDDVDPVSGEVKSRAEVVFIVPAPLTVALPPQPMPMVTGPSVASMAEGRPNDAGAPVPSDMANAPRLLAARPASPSPAQGEIPARAEGRADPAASSRPVVELIAPRAFEPGTILVPEVNTAIVSRGDNLWRISRRVYGRGIRYTVIYGANQGQIRNPRRIYPGQVFVLPTEQAQSAQ